MRDLTKATKSLETRKIRKILNEEARLGLTPNSDSEKEEVDLQKEVYPLGHYINNREEMIEQMFSIIKGAKLKKMLPPILKDMPLDELKADCLIHLLGMSKKRIRAILDGREINSSSDSESHSDSSSTPNKKPKIELKPFVIKQEGCSDISDNSEEVVLVDPDLDFLNLASNNSTKADTTEGKKKSKRKLKRKELDKKHKRTKTKVVEASDSDEVQQIDSSAGSESEKETETEAPKEGKTLLEILELEMRARAIRALLKSNDPQETEEPQQSVEVQKPARSKEKSDKHKPQEDTTQKVTPAKNFRKKKRKSDDVIVIAPKVVTIDLTEENEQLSGKSNEQAVEENTPSSTQNNNLNDESQETASNDKPRANNEGNQSLVSDNAIVINEELKNDHNTSESLKSCPGEKSSNNGDNNVTKSAQPEQDKGNWAQRWLESKAVKKVVSTSKICGNIRKKIKNAKLANKQTLVQEEPAASPSSPQKDIEGSVVEYELLSKSKTASISEVDKINDDDQAEMLSTTRQLAPAEDNSNETPSADQVQDVSSTRAENLSTNLVQDPGPSPQTKEDEIVHTSNYGESNIKLNANSNTHDSVENCETLVPAKADENKATDDFKCLNKIEESGNDCEQNQVDKSVNHDSDNLDKLKVREEEDVKISETVNAVALNEDSNAIDDSSSPLVSHGCENLDEIKVRKEEGVIGLEMVSSAALNEGSNAVDESSNPLLTDVERESETCPLIAERSKSNSPQSSDVDKKNVSSKEDKNQSITDTEILGRIIKESKKSTKVCEAAKEVSPACTAKSIHEQIEPEALEINITDEDRDIEDAIE